jgi:hypothetical protein
MQFYLAFLSTQVSEQKFKNNNMPEEIKKLNQVKLLTLDTYLMEKIRNCASMKDSEAISEERERERERGRFKVFAIYLRSVHRVSDIIKSD